MFNNTIAIFIKIKNDIKRICSITDVIVQLIFIFLYAFSVATNIGNTVRLIIFSVLLALSLTYFIFHIVAIRIEAKRFKEIVKKKVRSTFTYIKLFVQAFSLGFTVYEITHFGASDFTKVLTIVTIVCFVIQIVLEIIKVSLNYYITLLITAVDEDTKPIQNAFQKSADFKDALANPKALIFKALDKPLEFIANKLDNKDAEIAITEQPQIRLSKKEYKVRSKVLKLGEEHKHQKLAEKKLKAEKNDELKEQEANKQMSNVKRHFNTILNKFKKAKDDDKNK